LYFIIKGNVSFLYQGILCFTVLLSGSISGVLTLAFILFFINYDIIIKKIHTILPIACLLVLIMITVIAERTGGSVDLTQNSRYKFFMVFLKETKDWSFFKFLIGSDRISPLSSAGCENLFYWQSLFSYKKDGSCYSVIFHSYILRVIYDHGLVALFFISTFIYRIIKVSGYSTKNAIVVLGVVIINGLSVSSFNSIYFILSLIFFLGLNIEDKTKLNAVSNVK
jgi:hypothetical protein